MLPGTIRLRVEKSQIARDGTRGVRIYEFTKYLGTQVQLYLFIVRLNLVTCLVTLKMTALSLVYEWRPLFALKK